MSLTAEPASSASQSTERETRLSRASQRKCPHCSAPLAGDQEWCVECGTATTIIHRAPSVWVPIGIVSLVVAVALAGFIFAVTRVSTGSNPQPSSAPQSSSAASARSASSRSASSDGLTAIESWPSGLAGWTVVLAHTHRETIAYAKATALARAGVSAGVIDSTQHPGWIPGYWAVFSGRYSTEKAAKAAAASLVADGHQGAHPKLVEH